MSLLRPHPKSLSSKERGIFIWLTFYLFGEGAGGTLQRRLSKLLLEEIHTAEGGSGLSRAMDKKIVMLSAGLSKAQKMDAHNFYKTSLPVMFPLEALTSPRFVLLSRRFC